jgi:O-antigen/teichoic acid export membrane protein
VLILAAVFSLQDAAVYGAASRCMIAGVFLANALNQTIQPQLRREIAFGTRQTVREMYEATTTWLVLATWPLYIVMITHASIFMSIFGPEYASGGPVLSLLSSAMLVAIACGLVDVVLLMLGRSWLSTINVVVALVVNVTLNLLLAPHLGMIGSAIAWVAAILIGNLAPLFQTSRVGLHPGGRPLWTGCLITGLAFGLPLGVERLVFGSGVPAFVIALSISAVLYVVLLRLFRTWMLLDRLVDGLRSKASRPALPA